MRKKDMSKIKATDDEIVDQIQQVAQDPNSIQAKIFGLATLIDESDGVKSIKNGDLTSFAECDLAEFALDTVSKRIELISRYLLESRISITNKWISDNLLSREDVAKLYETVMSSNDKEGTTTINNDLDLRSTEVRAVVKKVRDIFFKGRKFANLVCAKVRFLCDRDYDGRDSLLMSFYDLEVDRTSTLVLSIPIAGSVKVDSSSSFRPRHDLVKGGVHVWLKNEGYRWRGADDNIFYNCYDIGKIVDAFKNSFGDKHPWDIWKYRDKFRRWSIDGLDQDLYADNRYHINSGFRTYSSFNF